MIRRAALMLTLMAAPLQVAAQEGPAPLTAEAGMARFGAICIDTLPDFEGAGAALIEAGVVARAEKAPGTWLSREHLMSFAVPTQPNGRPFCSVIFLSADDAATTEAARDAYFGDGERNAVDAALRHTTLINGSLVDFITLVDDRGERGVFVRLQAYPVPPKGTADKPAED